MLSVEKVYETFLSHDVDFFTGVPDSLLKNICAYITDHTSREKHIIAANEGAAVGIASGYYMASGKVPVVYMQNSGLGNTVNPLLSLADEQVYSFPMLLMIGWRGEPGTKDEPQHKKQGEVTLDLLKAMRIPYIILDSNENDAFIQLHDIIQSAKTKNIPHAIIIRKDVFGKYKLQKEFGCNYPLSREDALQIVVDYLPENSVVVSTTGKLSRELFEYREMKEQGHEHDFLTVGSMGHSSSISLGIAIAKQDRPVYCLDGDGAFIMHLGAISNIGDLSFKKRSQQIICLGYYTPFKDDYHMGDHSYDKFRNTTCNSFDYSIATSCLSARIISIDCGISYDKFKVLGFPRNDLLISKNNCNVIKREISKFAGYDVTKYIVYTPTFRDYETVTEGNLRSILGYVDCDLLKLSKILLKFNAALILKLHPLQNKTVLKKDLPKGILVFEQTYKYGLYDLLSFSDGMITDYTSTYFDFLLVNKPVIFNFYDIEEYRRVRGFSFEPIEFFCAGDIVYNYNELIDAVMGLLAGKDIHAEHRRHISLLMNQFQDDNSTKRICDIFLNEI